MAPSQRRPGGGRRMRHTVVVDLGVGDAGNGTVVDALCGPDGPAARAGTRVQAVVRFNGGARAARTVVLPDGRRHTFSQFGAGALRGVPTLLSRHALVDPVALGAEAATLARLGVADPMALVAADAGALLTTPWHVAVDLARERARELAHGADVRASCGPGTGEAVAFATEHPELAPRVGDAAAPRRLRRRLSALAEWARAAVADLGDVPGVPALPRVSHAAEVYGTLAALVEAVDGTDRLRRLVAGGPVVLEGTGGVLLDERYGFHPHVTRSSTTPRHALDLLLEAGAGAGVTCWGVTGSYATRYGAGPLVTEDAALARLLPEPDAAAVRRQGPFRVGYLDLVALRYARDAAGRVDALAVTDLDRLGALAAAGRLLVAAAWRTPDGALLERLPVALGPDLPGQRRLTELVAACEPILVPAPADRAEFARLLAAEVGLPVVLTSDGPTSRDTTWHLDAPLASSPELVA
jgi:adenylosuccinate synthase